jgi:hypothetical protein
MSVLSAFLNPIYAEETVEVFVGDRFIDPETKEPVPFKLRTLTQEERSELRKGCYVTKSAGDRKYQELDNEKYLCKCIVESCVSPDLKSKEVCDHFKTIDPADVPKKMLLGREFEKLGKAFMKLNGLDDESPEFGIISKN